MTNNQKMARLADRCIQLGVPKAMFPVACHEVIDLNLTMIVLRNSPLEIHAWFRDTQPIKKMQAKLFILHGK